MSEVPAEPVPAAPPLHVADLPARRGAAWLAEGFAIWRGQPLTWSGLSVGWLVITFGLLIIPVIGIVLAHLLQPVFFASFALAADKQLRAERLEMGDLFLGFKAPVRSLLNVGALLLFAELAIFTLMTGIGLPTGATGEGEVLNLADYARQLKGKEWIMLLGLSLMAVVKGALWFAPPLIAFHGLKTTHALRWSLYAALSNLGAMITYGLVLSMVLLVAFIPYGMGLIVAFPVMICSTYAGYKDVFKDQGTSLN